MKGYKGSLTAGVFFLIYAVFGVVFFIRDGSKVYLIEGLMAVLLGGLLIGGNRLAAGFGVVLNAVAYISIGAKSGITGIDILLTMMFLILGITILFSYLIRQKSLLWIAMAVLCVATAIFAEDTRADVFGIKCDYFLFAGMIVASYWSCITFGVEKRKIQIKPQTPVELFEPDKEKPVTQANLGEELKNIIREKKIEEYEILDGMIDDDDDY